jgi:hypothetical protein
MQIVSILELLKMLCDHGCEPQHQEEAGGDKVIMQELIT